MKILVLSNLYPPDVLGGYEVDCSEMVGALRARGHEVRVLTAAPRSPVPSAPGVDRGLSLADVYDPYCLEKNAPLTRCLCSAEARYVKASNVHALTTRLEEWRPDAVYVWNLYGLGGLGLMACLQHLAVPWVWHLLDAGPVFLCAHYGRREVVPALAREFQSRLRGSYLCCSRRVVEAIRSGGIDLSGSVEIVPPWVKGVRPAERTDYFHGGRLRIVSAGPAGLPEGAELIIDAAGRLRDRGRLNFSVDLYGRAVDPAPLGLIRRQHLHDVVTLHGPAPRDELASAYGRSDVFVSPNGGREPADFTPLEAAAHGCVPVVAGSNAGEAWSDHGVPHIRVDRSAEKFTDVFDAILRGGIELEPMGRAAGAVIWRDLHLDGAAARVEQVLEHAASQGRDGAGSASEAYRMALLAEKLTRVLIQEAIR